MRTKFLSVMALFSMLLVLPACNTMPSDSQARNDLRQEAQATVERFKQTGPRMHQYFNDSYAYAVFPEVTEGGLIVGGAFGRGAVYEQGQFIGYTSVTAGTFGAQIGGKEFSEVMFFKNRGAFDDFRDGDFTFNAGASATANDNATGTTVGYKDGVAVFHLARGGLMAAATVGARDYDFVQAVDEGPGVYATPRNQNQYRDDRDRNQLDRDRDQFNRDREQLDRDRDELNRDRDELNRDFE